MILKVFYFMNVSDFIKKTQNFGELSGE
jgi:hypothetical protein